MLVPTPRCGSLWVDVRGPIEGPPIVLWHSVLCDGSMWSTIPERLAALGYRVLNVDAPGHGRSEPVRGAYSLDDCVDAALSVLDASELDRAIWCGLSWGGMVGMRLAVRAPERVRALVLVDTNADKEVPEKLPRYRAMAAITRAFGPVPMILRRLPPIYFSPHTIRDAPHLVRDFLERIATMDRESIRRVVDAVILGREDFRPRLRDVRAPTLVMVGADDAATPLARSLDIASRVPTCRLVEIPRAGHLASLEQPEIVGDVLTRFLAELPSEARGEAA